MKTLKLVLVVLAVVCMICSGASAGPSISMHWSSTDTTLTPILCSSDVQPQDYVNISVYTDTATCPPSGPGTVASNIQGIVPWSQVTDIPSDNFPGSPVGQNCVHSYQLCADLSCPTQATHLFYDAEHWVNTPNAQQNDPAGSWRAFANSVHSFSPCNSSPVGNLKAGIDFDGNFWSITTCALGNYSGLWWYHETVANGGTLFQPWVDFGAADDVDFQFQDLNFTNDTNGCYGSLQTWTNAINTAIAWMRLYNASIKVFAQQSLRDSAPDTIAQNIIDEAARQIHPDVYYIAYPNPTGVTQCTYPRTFPTPAPGQSGTCTYASESNYLVIMHAIGRTAL